MHCNCSNQKPFEEALRFRASNLLAFWLGETGSTNDEGKALVRQATENVAAVIVADHQSTGRGTRGRVWNAPAVSLLLTVIVPLPVQIVDFSGLSLVVGATCVQVLKKINPLVRLKWPNDLWIGDGKVAGILCELVRNRNRRLHAVVGIGVNICLGESSFMTDTPVSALVDSFPNSWCEQKFRIETAAHLSVEIEKVCRKFDSDALLSVREHWTKLDAFAGRKVLLTLPTGESIEGQVTGIGMQGELLFADTKGQVGAFADARIRPLATE